MNIRNIYLSCIGIGMSYTICAMCGRAVYAGSGNTSFYKYKRIEHLELEHLVTNIPARMSMMNSKKIFVVVENE